MKVENLDVVYPEYYQREYHSYAQGNLCWQVTCAPATLLLNLHLRQAAMEAAGASLSAALIAYPDRGLGADEHSHNLFCQHIRHQTEALQLDVTRVLDAGCGIGQNTLPLANSFPEAPNPDPALNRQQRRP